MLLMASASGLTKLVQMSILQSQASLPAPVVLPSGTALLGKAFLLALKPYFPDALRYSVQGLPTGSGLRMDATQGQGVGQ